MKSPATVNNSSREKILPESVIPKVNMTPATSPAKASRVAIAMIPKIIHRDGGIAWPLVLSSAKRPKSAPGITSSLPREPKIARK